jgi:hypothetical protein
MATNNNNNTHLYIDVAGKSHGPMPRNLAWKMFLDNNGQGTVRQSENGPALEAQIAEDTVGAPILNTPTPAGEVSSVAAERIARHAAAFEAQGLVGDGLWYAPGTKVHEDTAQQYMRISRKKHEDKPDTAEALQKVRDLIQDELRKDVIVRVGDLRMNERGFLYRDANKPLPITLSGQGRLLGLLQSRYDLFPNAARFMAALSPEDRAQAFNSQMEKVSDTGKEEDLKLRLRWQNMGDGHRTPAIFAAVSPSYRELDGDVLADYVRDALRHRFTGLPTPRGTVIYDPASGTLRADAIFHADRVVDMAVGDVFKGGIRFRTSDVGGGSIRGDLLLWRNMCMNMMIFKTMRSNVMKITHRGDDLRQRVAQGVWAAVDKTEELIQAFAADWGILRRTKIEGLTLWGESFRDAEDVIRFGLVEKRIKPPAGARALGVEDVLKALAAEPQRDSLADVVNAFTRAAHESPIGQTARESWEQYAGNQLMPELVRVGQRAM